MSVSSINSGYQLIQQSKALEEEAAREIAEESMRDDLAFNRIDYEKEPEKVTKEKPSVEESLNKLEQARSYNRAGADVVQRSDDVIGSILDTHI